MSEIEQARAFFEQDNLGEAAKLYNVILSRDPANLEAAERLGVIMARTKNLVVAEQLFRHQIKYHPNDAAGYSNLSNALKEQNKIPEAIEAIQKAIELDGKNIIYYLNFAGMCLNIGDVTNAIKYYKEALKLEPNSIPILSALTDLTSVISPVETYEYMKKFNAVFPQDTLKIGLKTFVPIFYESQTEIDEFRQQLDKNLDKLLKQELHINIEDTRRIYDNTFYLAYHNRNNRDFKSKLAQIYAKAIPDLLHTAPHIKNYKHEKGKKIKLGIISSFFYRHPVSRCFGGFIIELCKDERFEVHILYIPVAINPIKAKQDEHFQWVTSEAHEVHMLSEKYFETRKEIENLELDAMLYLDIGMYWLTYLLSFSRLAPVQMLVAGHPDTSGVPTMDYFFIGNDMEAPGAEDHYTEKMVRLKNITNYFETQKLPEKFKTRAELGLPEDKTIYYCPMKNHKIHSDFDFALRAILEKDENAVILLPSDSGKISEMALNRMRRNIGKLTQRIIYHPWASNVEFMSYLKTADVVIDTFYFGSGTTLVALFTVDAPLVVLPGTNTGGRVAYASYKTMGIDELIAKDKDDFVNLAVKTANDKEFRAKVVQKIHEKKHVLFDNPAAAHEMADFIEEKVDAF